MNFFNRLLAIGVAGLFLLAGLVALAGVAGLAGTGDPPPTGSLAGLTRAAVLFYNIPGVSPLWVGTGAGVLTALGLGLLALELRPARHARDLLLQQDRTGVVSISLLGLRRLADHVIGEIPGVQDVASEARPAGKGLGFRCRVVVAPETSAPELADTIRARLDAAVRQHTGLAASRIDVHTRVDGAITRKRVR